MHILVDVGADRLQREIIDLLERAGHTIEHGAATPQRSFDVALVGSPEIAEKLREGRPYDAIVVATKLGDVPARARARGRDDDAIDRCRSTAADRPLPIDDPSLGLDVPDPFLQPRV